MPIGAKAPTLQTGSGRRFAAGYLRGGTTERQQVPHIDGVRRASWRIVGAGGSLAAGFYGTIGHSDVWNRRDAPNRCTFQVRDEGAAAQLRVLYAFFTALPFWRLQPFDGITGEAQALAAPGVWYVLYLATA